MLQKDRGSSAWWGWQGLVGAGEEVRGLRRMWGQWQRQLLRAEVDCRVGGIVSWLWRGEEAPREPGGPPGVTMWVQEVKAKAKGGIIFWGLSPCPTVRILVQSSALPAATVWPWASHQPSLGLRAPWSNEGPLHATVLWPSFLTGVFPGPLTYSSFPQTALQAHFTFPFHLLVSAKAKCSGV